MAMIDIAKLRIGDKVRYQPSHFDVDKWENGIIKEIRSDNMEAVFVVYNCGGDWENYKNYTAALTKIEDLYFGWKH